MCTEAKDDAHTDDADEDDVHTDDIHTKTGQVHTLHRVYVHTHSEQTESVDIMHTQDYALRGESGQKKDEYRGAHVLNMCIDDLVCSQYKNDCIDDH